MTDAASLRISIDSTDVKQGITDLNQLSIAGAKAETSAKGVAASASEMARSAIQAAQGTSKMSLAANNARIAQMELMHAVRGSVDSFAAGAPATQIFAQHLSMVAEAASFMGSSMGRVGAFLGGPWGLAVTAAASVSAVLISRIHDSSESVDGLVGKLQKHHDQTLMSEQADRLWANTLDGLGDSLRKSNEELQKRLQLQPVVDRNLAANAQALATSLGQKLDTALATPGVSQARILKLEQDFQFAVQQSDQARLIVAQQVGAAMVDLTARAERWEALQTNIINNITGYHPELKSVAADLFAAFNVVKKGVEDAAQASVNFDPFTKRVDALNEKLLEAPSFVQGYIAELKKLGVQLEATAEAAKIDPVKQFEQAVIGAEGTGRNRLGSSAAGFGQFMPKTWDSYFDRLFPDKASLDEASKLAFRNVRDVAQSVIDAATKDYVEVLKHAGQQITAANLYAVHLLGQRDATKLLGAAPGTPTSSILSGQVLSGNPFLRGTAGSARDAIAQRIGDSSSGVSSAAITIQHTLDSAWDKFILGGQRASEETVKLVDLNDNVVNLIEQYNKGISRSATLEGESEDALKLWIKQYDQVIASQQELNRFGGQLIDDVLNPDNWTSFGHAAKTVLHEILQEMMMLAAANPLKNMLLGTNLPTLGGGGGLGGILGSIGKLFSGASAGTTFAGTNLGVNFAGLSFRANGGAVNAGQPYIVGEKGPELFRPSQSGSIVPNNRLGAGADKPQQIEVTIVTAPSDAAWAEVSNISARQIGSAAPVIVKAAAESTVKALTRRTLNGG